MSVRETGAAAIWAAEHDMPCEWETVPQADQEMYLRMFDGAVRAYTLLAAKRGWRMVPEEAVPCMFMEPARRRENWRAEMGLGDVWRLMLAAAPKFEAGE